MEKKRMVSPYAPLLAARGVTQKDLAARLDKSETAVSAWFTGKSQPRLTLAEWKVIAGMLGTTVDNLPDTFAPQPVEDS